jgi:hypothetical protein
MEIFLQDLAESHIYWETNHGGFGDCRDVLLIGVVQGGAAAGPGIFR